MKGVDYACIQVLHHHLLFSAKTFKDQVEDAFLSVFVEVRVLFRQSLAMNGRSSPHKPF